MALPHDPFNRARMPGDFSREGRVRLLGEACEALLRGEAPNREAAIFLASALSGWLRSGGNLERDFLKVVAPRGSHRKPEVIWREHSLSLIGDERQDADG